MKKFVTLIVGWLAGSAVALAQGVTAELVMDQEYFLPHEAMIVKVRITNFSGQSLELGKDDDWLSFTVASRDNRVVSMTDPVAVKGEFSLESSKVATRSVDLAPCFDMSRPGHYTVRATVKLPQWQNSLQTQAKGFDIMTGAKLWEQDFGVPGTARVAGGQPEVRKFSLTQTIHLKQLRLYLRLSDAAESKVFRVFPIGPMVSFSKPEPQLDKFSNLHVLYQTGARSFNYSVINPDGLIIARETHEYSNTRPVLRVDKDGRIAVTGGTRRSSRDDLPPPEKSLSAVSDETPPR